jgi:RNA polymerase sigma factor (sigma-70 family)
MLSPLMLAVTEGSTRTVWQATVTPAAGPATAIGAKRNPHAKSSQPWRDNLGPTMTPPDGEDTVAALFEAHAPALVLYARQWVGSADAEDVLQRVFVRLLASGRMPSAPRPWLFRCVRNEAITAWRSDQRRVRREAASAAAGDDWLVPSTDDPLDARTAQAALLELPPEQREAITLRFWSGLKLAEIASVTGVDTSTVQRRCEAALAALRQRLERRCRSRNT